MGRYKLDSVGVQEVRWGRGGTVRAGVIYLFFNGKGKENYQLGAGFLVQHRIVPAVNRLAFVTDRTYIVLGGR
jgi:hypothetical protein